MKASRPGGSSALAGLVSMGDEIALLNDDGYHHDPRTAKDNRWMHRPVMDWARAAARHDPSVGRRGCSPRSGG